MRIRILQSCSMSVVVGIKSLSLVEYSDSGVASGVTGRGADCTGRHFLAVSYTHLTLPTILRV